MKIDYEINRNHTFGLGGYLYNFCFLFYDQNS